MLRLLFFILIFFHLDKAHEEVIRKYFKFPVKHLAKSVFLIVLSQLNKR